MIKIDEKLSISEDSTDENLYKALKQMGYNPRYNCSSSYTYAYIDILVNGDAVTIKFNDHKHDDKKAQIRSITKRIIDPVFPSTFLTLYKRHWWN